MEYTTNEPKEPGLYHGRYGENDVVLRKYPGNPMWNIYRMSGEHIGVMPHDRLLFGPRIEPPQPVPEEVMEIITKFRNGTRGMIVNDFRRICDHIDPPAKLPDVTIPGEQWAAIQGLVRDLRRTSTNQYLNGKLDQLGGLMEPQP